MYELARWFSCSALCSSCFLRSTALALLQTHLNMLINVVGVVTRRTAVFPQLKVVHYTCAKCGALVGPFQQTDQAEIQIGSCPDCQSKGPYSVSSQHTIYRNFQKMTLQEVCVGV
jgi:DNA replication licensing factor MCM2